MNYRDIYYEHLKEEKKMNIYDYADSRPDYVSNPLTAINTMIMIGNLKERFGDRLHETARKGYFTMRDVIPCKYYKLYLWYWCDSCCYGIRECTEEDFNIKEDKEMTKEEALKKIEELKEYVEKCEEKEKEIPEMPHRGKYNIHLVVPDKPRNPYTLWNGSFKNQESSDIYNILAFELANLVYVREYLGVKNNNIWEARTKGLTVFCVIYCSDENEYAIIEIHPLAALRSHEFIWCFTDNREAQRVCDYMNKYVRAVKKEMF